MGTDVDAQATFHDYVDALGGLRRKAVAQSLGLAGSAHYRVHVLQCVLIANAQH